MHEIPFYSPWICAAVSWPKYEPVNFVTSGMGVPRKFIFTPNSLYRAARFANIEVACEYSRQCSPCSSPLRTRLALKNKTENGEGNRDGEWIEFLSREGGRHCFILACDKNRKGQKNPQRHKMNLAVKLKKKNLSFSSTRYQLQSTLTCSFGKFKLVWPWGRYSHGSTVVKMS